MTDSRIALLAMGQAMPEGKPDLLVRQIGRQNRVVLPPEVMRLFRAKVGDFVAFELHGDRVTLIPMELQRRDRVPGKS